MKKQIKNIDMKSINSKLIAFLAIFVFLFSSCEDFNSLLDKQETGDMNLEKVYSDIRNADQILTDIYSRLPMYFNNDQNKNGKLVQGNMADGYTAFGGSNLSFAPATIFNAGSWSASVNYTTTNTDRPTWWGDYYRWSYEGIRAAYLFLENIEKVPYDAEYGYSQIERDIKIGEAKFLMAYWNYDLLRHYGGFTIVERSLQTTDEEVKGVRNTYDECVTHIVKLCDEAAGLLPQVWATNQTGRATKGAAMALKANALLFAASPLFNNPQKPDDSPFRGKYDENKWKLAAQAAADVIKLNQYSLVTDLKKMFNSFTTTEAIFQRNEVKGFQLERTTLPSNIGWTSTNGGRNQVTYTFMKNYKILKNGQAYDLEDPAGGFDLQNPYINLDPRFYRDIAYNGANLRQNRVVQCWALGANTTSADAAKNLSQANTYLYNIKMCDLDIKPLSMQNGGLTFHNYNIIRYAEILLNYAEAMNEAYGADVDPLGIGLTAVGAINLIRGRTKCESYPEFMGKTYSMPLMPEGMTKEVARKEIRQERMIELGFEDNIFYDIRRWKVPVESQQTAEILVPIAYRETAGGVRKIKYEIQKQTRPFNSSWYIFPIPEVEIRKNPKLVQNPGWPGSPETEN